MEETPEQGAFDREKLRLKLRRSRILANRATELAGGKAECPFCRKGKSRHSLAEHIRRQHPTELAATSADLV